MLSGADYIPDSDLRQYAVLGGRSELENSSVPQRIPRIRSTPIPAARPETAHSACLEGPTFELSQLPELSLCHHG